MNDMAAIWTRDTPWRQGNILPTDAAKELKLTHQDTPDKTCVIVISHDCDLANGNLQIEPAVEVIIGRIVQNQDGNFSWAKSPRTLHLDVQHNNVKVVIELIATSKRLVPKNMLAPFVPDATYSLSGKSLSVLRSWLSARYNRTAFPDAFVEQLSQTKTDRSLAKLIEPTSNLLSAVYFDVDGGKEIDRTDGSPYELSIVLTYPPGDDPDQTADEVEKLEESIETLFSNKHFDLTTNKWSGIALKQCMSISEDDLTVSKTRSLAQWRFEYMTLKADDT